jgi:two-component system response regulator HydG
MKQLLIVDDDVAVTNYLMVFLMQTEKFETSVVNDSREVAPLLAEQTFDVMLLDMDMPNVSGLDVLKHLRAAGIDLPVIILTGVSDVDLAVRSLKLGAFDYLTKPVDEEKLLEVIDSALEHQALHHTIEQMPQQLKREDLKHKAAFDNFPTQHSETIRLLHQAEKMASSDLTIFIRGEIGSGKRETVRGDRGGRGGPGRAAGPVLRAGAALERRAPGASRLPGGGPGRHALSGQDRTVVQADADARQAAAADR